MYLTIDVTHAAEGIGFRRFQLDTKVDYWVAQWKILAKAVRHIQRVAARGPMFRCRGRAERRNEDRWRCRERGTVCVSIAWFYGRISVSGPGVPLRFLSRIGREFFAGWWLSVFRRWKFERVTKLDGRFV